MNTPFRRKEAWAGYLFIAPNIAGFLTFTAFPLIASFLLSLTTWDILTPWNYVGIDNYTTMANDPLFWEALGNTLYYTAGVVPFQVVLSFLIAFMLSQGIRGLTMYRTVYFLPVVTSLVAVSTVWKWMYQPQSGLINYFLSLIGIAGPAWLASVHWAMPGVIITSIWKGLGFPIVIFLAGLQGIPESYYEAARIDGATERQQVRYITIPLLSPTTFFVTVITVIQSFQVFGSVYVMTRGGPGDATRTIVYLVFDNAFSYFQMGYASALAWCLAAIVLVLTMIQWRLRKRWVHLE